MVPRYGLLPLILVVLHTSERIKKNLETMICHQPKIHKIILNTKIFFFFGNRWQSLILPSKKVIIFTPQNRVCVNQYNVFHL